MIDLLLILLDSISGTQKGIQLTLAVIRVCDQIRDGSDRVSCVCAVSRRDGDGREYQLTPNHGPKSNTRCESLHR